MIAIRIVSQNEKHCIPFDKVIISTGTKLEKNNFVHTVTAKDSLWGKPVTLGKYSTADYAQMAFELIILHSCSDAKVFRMPKENEL